MIVVTASSAIKTVPLKMPFSVLMPPVNVACPEESVILVDAFWRITKLPVVVSRPKSQVDGVPAPSEITMC